MADFYKTSKPADVKPSRKRKNTGTSLNRRRRREPTDRTDAIAIDKSLTETNNDAPVRDNIHAHVQTGACEGNPGLSEPGDDNRPSEALAPAQVQTASVASALKHNREVSVADLVRNRKYHKSIKPPWLHCTERDATK